MKSADLKVGDRIDTGLVTDLKRTTIVQYAGASGDYNPLHTDEVFATNVAGYPSVLAHGMLTMGMTGRLLTDLFGLRGVIKFGGRFTSQLFPGDTLTGVLQVEATDDHVADVSVETRNQNDVVVFKGYGSGRLGAYAP